MKKILLGTFVLISATAWSYVLIFPSCTGATCADIFLFDAKNPASAVRAVARGQIVLVDVRTTEEWVAGHAEGAIHFDLARLEAGERVSISSETPILLYCRTGRRAGVAKEILERNGFSHVAVLGGLSDWEAAGGVVVR